MDGIVLLRDDYWTNYQPYYHFFLLSLSFSHLLCFCHWRVVSKIIKYDFFLTFNKKYPQLLFKVKEGYYWRTWAHFELKFTKFHQDATFFQFKKMLFIILHYVQHSYMKSPLSDIFFDLFVCHQRRTRQLIRQTGAQHLYYLQLK